MPEDQMSSSGRAKLCKCRWQRLEQPTYAETVALVRWEYAKSEFPSTQTHVYQAFVETAETT